MCGIVGVYDHSRSGQRIDPVVFDAMVDSLAHRGPDGRGVWHGEGISLGHRRLSILDPTPAGAQPMLDTTRTCVVTYNGEIYNFQEIRDELRQAGHHFQTNCDTEVLLASYLQWGTHAAIRFNGIFAFALWDALRRRLWLVRDRLGIKPLFYSVADGMLRFASEIKAILTDSSVLRRSCRSGLNAFLSFGYVPAPYTGFEGILQLPPAHEAVVEHGTVMLRAYWSLSMEETAMTGEDALEQFGQRFHRAVKRQMVSDVPLGGFLSGGVDSAAVVAEMAAVTPGNVHTFSVGFGEASFNEAELAATTARLVGTKHTQTEVSLDLAETLDKILDHCEEPFADSSALAVYHLCRMAACDVKVALSGDGADELLAGYATYSATVLAGGYRKIPSWFRTMLRHWVCSWPASDLRYSRQQFARRFVCGAEEPRGRDFASWRIHLSSNDKRFLCKEGFFAPGEDPLDWYAAAYHSAPGAISELKRMLYADLTFYLPNDMLVKVDRMSMAHGLEVRVPFLDHEFVEFCARLPGHYLARLPFPRHNKLILRKMLARNLGTPLSSRRKTGFNVPIEKAMRGDLFSCFRDSVQSQVFRESGPFDTDRIIGLAERHRRREIDAGHALFSTLVLALWWEKWLSGPAQR